MWEVRVCGAGEGCAVWEVRVCSEGVLCNECGIRL